MPDDTYYFRIAKAVAQGSSCRRRAVGAIAIDAHGRIIATGYNGVVRGASHCHDVPCGYEHNAKGFCMAIHAEANMLMHAHDTFTIDTVFTTCAPCIHCAKLIANTPCRRVVYEEDYTPDSLLFLKNQGIKCDKVEIPLANYVQAVGEVFNPKAYWTYINSPGANDQ